MADLQGCRNIHAFMYVEKTEIHNKRVIQNKRSLGVNFSDCLLVPTVIGNRVFINTLKVNLKKYS